MGRIEDREQDNAFKEFLCKEQQRIGEEQEEIGQ